MELTFEVPKELEEDMKKLPRIELSLAITRIVNSEFERFARLKQIVARSKLTEEDVKEFSDKADSAVAKRFRESLSR